MSEEKTSSSQTELISLIKELVYNFVCLISQHLKLFREEMKDEAFKIGKSIILMCIAICSTVMAAFFGGIFLIITISIFTSVWLSVLLVTILYLLIPTILFIYVKSQFKKIAKNRKKFAKEIEKTLEDGKKWLEQLKS